jgi:xylulokinase
MQKYILAHDIGTSGNKATLYNFEGVLCSSILYEYKTYFPGRNCVEQDPDDWWKAVCVSTQQLIGKAGIKRESIACVSFSAQMNACLPVDRNGDPLQKAIIWADTRSVRQVAFMQGELGGRNVYEITGHRISPSYTGPKLLWLQENNPEIYSKTYKTLQAKDYIIFRLTGNFVTDYSDATGTNLFDIKKKV